MTFFGRPQAEEKCWSCGGRGELVPDPLVVDDAVTYPFPADRLYVCQSVCAPYRRHLRERYALRKTQNPSLGAA